MRFSKGLTGAEKGGGVPHAPGGRAKPRAAAREKNLTCPKNAGRKVMTPTKERGLIGGWESAVQREAGRSMTPKGERRRDNSAKRQATNWKKKGDPGDPLVEPVGARKQKTQSQRDIIQEGTKKVDTLLGKKGIAARRGGKGNDCCRFLSIERDGDRGGFKDSNGRVRGEKQWGRKDQNWKPCGPQVRGEKRQVGKGGGEETLASIWGVETHEAGPSEKLTTNGEGGGREYGDRLGEDKV